MTREEAALKIYDLAKELYESNLIASSTVLMLASHSLKTGVEKEMGKAMLESVTNLQVVLASHS